MEQLRIGILGFGNLGRGAAAAVSQSPDMALAGIFTRRPPEQVAAEAGGMPVCPAALLEEGGPPVDVLLLCGGSAGDLPRQSPRYAGRFHVVDSFDTHARAPEHFAAVDAAARRGGRAAVICAGWDPGLFSVLRALALAALPRGESHTFWGEGVSQGHSEAIRRLPGVVDARAYTVPIPAALEAARAGEGAELTPGSMHRRVCCVALLSLSSSPQSLKYLLLVKMILPCSYRSEIRRNSSSASWRSSCMYPTSSITSTAGRR